MNPVPLPVIDLTGFREDDPDSRRTVPTEIDRALTETGFFQLVGHGVPDDVIGDAWSVLTAFFDLPAEQKRRAYVADRVANRGYAELGSEALSYSLGDASPPDLFEAFNVGRDRPPDEPYYQRERHRMFHPNTWPERPVGFRPAVVAYFDALEGLAATMDRAAALALDLDEAFFADRCGRGPNVLRAINYQHRSDTPAPAPGQMGMGAHSDYGAMTFLRADPVPGLEILGADGDWQEVIPLADAFVVNIGDLLAEWTNDRWRSTIHRVVPVGRGEVARRRSAAFFHEVDYDTLVECLPSCCSPERPARYEPVIAGEHLRAKVLGPRTGEASVAMSTRGDRSTS